MRKLFCSLCFLGIALSVFAEKIDSTKALKAANAFFSIEKSNLKSSSTSNSRLTIVSSVYLLATSEPENVSYYIISKSEGGYVIISGDNSVPPILGYSMEGKIGPNSIPPAFLDWLQWREKEIKYVSENNIAMSSAVSQAWDNLLHEKSTLLTTGTAIAPLIKTKWNQGAYYNALCPSQTPTGCGATVMAQIMKYWEYPISGSGNHSYTPSSHPEYGTLSANFGTTTYQWDQMPNSVISANNSVASLMYHCGVSVDMDYDPNGSISNTGNITTSLKTYFNYKSTLSYQSKSSMTDQAWVNLISTELNNNRPVFLRGANSVNNGGHFYICDGYNSNNYFHINWGWGGSYDGYFLFTSLTPGGSDYSYYQSMISGIEPSTNSLALDLYNLSLTSASGSNNKFRIVSNTSWKVSDNQGWLDISDSTGTGCSYVTVTANSENTSGVDRTASINISVAGLTSKTITVTQVAASTQLPNLTPYKLSAWSDKIVVSNVQGTSTDNTINDNDIVYVDYSFINNGSKKTENVFYGKLFLDDVEVNEVVQINTVDVNYYKYYTDFNLGILSAGTHTLKISVDPTGQVTESNETDNIYSKTFTVAVAETTLTVPPNSLTLTADANSSSTFSITSNTSWTVSDNQTWLTVSPASGSNNGIVTVIATQNTSLTSTRTAKVTISGTGVTPKFVTVVQSVWKLPNLTPYKPSTWSDKILVSNVSDATTDNALTTNNSILVSYSIINNGNIRTEGTFNNTLYLDDVLINTKVRSDSLKANYYTSWRNIGIGKLSAGSHTLKISLDYSNLLAESDETDNIYSKTFTVTSSVGITTENIDNQVVAFPNPVSDMLNIKNTSKGVKDITIKDIAGKIYLSKQVSDINFELNISQLPSGYYILVIKSNDSLITKNLVKL